MGMKTILMIMAVAAAFAAGTMGRVIMVENDNDAFKLTSDNVYKSAEKESYAGETRAGDPKIEKFPVQKLKHRDMQEKPICTHEGQPCKKDPPNEDGDDRFHCDFGDGENCICSSEYLSGDPNLPVECVPNFDGPSHQSTDVDSGVGDEISSGNDAQNYGGGSSSDEDYVAPNTDEEYTSTSTDEDYIASSSDEDYSSSNSDENSSGSNSDR